jgi:hypothetical protein
VKVMYLALLGGAAAVAAATAKQAPELKRYMKLRRM